MRLKSVLAGVIGAAVILSSAIPALAADDTPRKLKFGSMSVGSGSYNRNMAMANVMNKELPQGWSVEISPVSTGGVAGTLLVENGVVDMDEGINVPNKLMMAGELEMKGKKLPAPQKARSFIGGLDYAYHMTMFSEDFHNKAGVDTLEEVIAKKIPFNLVTKAPGSAGELGARLLLKALGVTYDDIKSWGGNVYHVAPSQMADLLRDGKADVSIDVTGLGQPAMQELTMTKNMFFPQLGEGTLKALNEMGYAPKVMPKGTWKNQDKDINTMVSSADYVVSLNVPDEIVYAITKAVVENKPELVRQLPVMEQYIPEKSAEPILRGLPLHPGAEKYYRDKGMIK